MLKVVDVHCRVSEPFVPERVIVSATVLPDAAQCEEGLREAERLEQLAASLRELAAQLPTDVTAVLRTLANACTHGAELARFAYDGQGIAWEVVAALHEVQKLTTIARKLEQDARQYIAEHAPRGSR